MPLHEITKTRLVPATAGWYWLRDYVSGHRKWSVVQVFGGSPETLFYTDGNDRRVEINSFDNDREWGPEVLPPS